MTQEERNQIRKDINNLINENEKYERELSHLDKFLQGKKVEDQIIGLVYKKLEELGADSNVLSAIGSWHDTLSNEDVLHHLKEAMRQINEH